jgi:thioredoxin reductase
VIIGGGVAGYVAAIKAGQEGLKARNTALQPPTAHTNSHA